MAIYKIGTRQPRLGGGVWIADNATVIGDVRLGEHASVWFNAVLRGDNDPISVGTNANIQDGSVLHT
ncbi:MAG TPA: gamma carbonic anhydrase family protein, partial [Rhodocyclaceae bacterium]